MAARNLEFEISKVLSERYVKNRRCVLCGQEVSDVLMHFKQNHIRELENVRLELLKTRVKPAMAKLDQFM
jgi:hypothetical protein